ncbi:MAG: hypothetical protein A2073_03425 [Deltaproteobacteria bacterium GWC2_42_11]|nr:MAG: hypothetical protein A2073_03425 [Deltaproteobacteria bacterium GWC2_42_11]HBO84580.1 glucokinase [Deltaproteobacteria bacterium]
MKYAIGIDLGGTNLKIAAVTPKGRVISYTVRKSRIVKDRKTAVRNLVRCIRDIEKSIKGKHLIGVGAGIAGTVKTDKGIVSQSPNLPELEGTNLKDEISDILSCPFFIDNDANVFAMGEGWCGSAKDCKNFCGITLGTGVGGGIVIDGRIFHGSCGAAGEVGHIVVEPMGAQCRCGSFGCLEAYASSTGLVRMAIDDFYSRNAVSLRRLCNNNKKKITPEVIARLAERGDSFCISLFEMVGTYLGIAMADIVNLLNPELIVIGGGLSKSAHLFLNTAKKEFKRRSLKAAGKNIKIVTASSDKAGVVGAAYMVLKRFGAI